MSSASLWSKFRKFRTASLSLVSILCLIWGIIISVYMAKNWSGYDGGQRGLLFGLVALDFISSVLVYLMVVVKYRFWPDAVRTVILIGLHAAGTILFMIHSPRFPCNAFGSAAICHRLTVAIIAGSLVISSLLIVYGISLPLMAFVPPPISPQTEDDPEDTPGPKIEDEPVLEKRKSHASSGSRAWLLKNQEGVSPELNASVLPRPLVPGATRGHSHTSSSLSSLNLPQPTHLMHEVDVEGYRGQPGTPRFESLHSCSSPRSSAVRAVRAPLISAADRDLNVSGSSSTSSVGDAPSRSSSSHIFPLPNRFKDELTDENRVSLVSTDSYGSAASGPESPIVTKRISEAPRRSATLTIASSSSASVYSQPSASSHLTAVTAKVPLDGQSLARDNRGTTSSAFSDGQSSLPQTPGQDSILSMTDTVHDDLDQVNELEIPADGFLSPPLTALPSPGVSAGSAQTTFELHLSDSPQEPIADVPAYVMDKQRERIRQDSLATIMSPSRPRPHVRNESMGSNVDMDEWKRLVMSAAGKS